MNPRRALPAALLLSLLATAPPAAAGFVPGPDVVGIYTAADSSGRCWIDLGIGDHTTLYLCLSDWTDPIGVTGWEMRIDWPLSDLVVTTTLQGEALDVGEPPDHLVGLASILRGEEAIVLAEFDVFSMGDAPLSVSIGPASVQSLPGEMCYSGVDPGLLYAMTPSSHAFDLPVFYINGRPGPHPCDDVTPVARTTWSAVKAMYR